MATPKDMIQVKGFWRPSLEDSAHELVGKRQSEVSGLFSRALNESAKLAGLVAILNTIAEETEPQVIKLRRGHQHHAEAFRSGVAIGALITRPLIKPDSRVISGAQYYLAESYFPPLSTRKLVDLVTENSDTRSAWLEEQSAEGIAAFLEIGGSLSRIVCEFTPIVGVHQALRMGIGTTLLVVDKSYRAMELHALAANFNLDGLDISKA